MHRVEYQQAAIPCGSPCPNSRLCGTFRDMAATNGSRRVPHLRLKELRINSGMTPNDLAFRAGLSGKTVRMVETGFVPTPRVQFQIAKVFELLPLDLWPLERDRQRVAA